jgi:DNA invertase Pin-like site-specific DNA recombinase
MMHLRQPIVIPTGKTLRVLIHARFSTEEQKQSSIDDQVASCRSFLESNLPKGYKPQQVVVEVITEPEVSGEIADRPGINQVWAGIEAKRWDVILAEESSRLYRHHTKAGELFESAVDADVRIICPSDVLDTLDDDWPDRLHMCQMQHARSNFYTRLRIRRAHDGLWARGAAVGNTVIGYKRRPTVPATESEPAKGPFYDEIDEEKAAVIREIFKRIANGETAAEVAEWLDSIKVAKAKWSRQAKWTAGNVNAVIRRTIYRGFETNRKKVSKRKLRTGKSEYVWNDEDKIQTRESPHLRIVSDHLWYKANEVVDGRRCRASAPRHHAAAARPALRRVRLWHLRLADLLLRKDQRLLPLLGRCHGQVLEPGLLHAGAGASRCRRGSRQRGAVARRRPGRGSRPRAGTPRNGRLGCNRAQVDRP